MTVTIVLGKVTDGYADSYASSYSTARTGPADLVAGGNIGWFGQNPNDGLYRQFQTFIGFDFSAVPATEQVIAAQVHLTTDTAVTPSRSRSAELRGYVWSGGGLTTGDWRNPTQLAALTLFGRSYNVHQSQGSRWVASSDALMLEVPSITSLELVLTTDRQLSATPPTEDEGTAVYTADADGTANDPALVYTTVTRSKVVPALGASVRLSTGDWVHLITSGTGGATAALWLVPKAGGTSGTQVGTVPVGDAGEFATGIGAQALALAVDSSDNLYVVGRLSGSVNTLAAMAFTKNSGLTWTARTIRTAALPSYDGLINNVALAWHAIGGGRLMALVGHNSGSGAPSSHLNFSNDLVWALLDTTYLRLGTGSLLKGSGSMVGTLASASYKVGYNGLPTNESGTSLDAVAAGGVNTAWGFVASVDKTHILGGNQRVGLGRYILNAAGTGLDSSSVKFPNCYGVKDANAKIRVLRISESVVCLVTADQDTGWGPAFSVQQYSGASPEPNELGFVRLAQEPVFNMPAEAVLAKANNWDAVYNESENRIWFYYVDSVSPNVLRRTAIDLNSMQALRNSVIVSTMTAGRVINAIRVPRNAAVTEKVIIECAYTQTGVIGTLTVTDTFNLPPTSPILTPVTNYDATGARTFLWTFQDPNGDSQSAYQLQIVDTDLGTTVVDTGKVVSTFSQHNVTANTLANAKNYQWRVTTWDALDTAGEWSEFGSFQTSAGGTVTITVPATDNEAGQDTDDLTITWSVTGTTQASYRVITRRMSDLVAVQDTNWVTSTATTATVTGLASDVQYRLEVQVRNAALTLSGIGQRLVLPSYSRPESPVVTVTPVDDQGYVLVSVDNPLPGAPTVPGATEYGFETGGVTDWTATGGALADSTEQAHSGTHSMKLTVSGGPVAATARDLGHRVPVTEGVRYTARMWVYRPVTGNVSAVIDWYNGAGVFISSSTAAVAAGAAVWTLAQVTATAPTGAVSAAYGPSLTGSPANGTIVYTDDMGFTGASDRPEVTRNQVLRRAAGSADAWDLVGETGLDGSMRDYTATSGKLHVYKVRGIA